MMTDLYVRWMELPEPLPRESYLNDLPAVKYLAEEKIAMRLSSCGQGSVST